MFIHIYILGQVIPGRKLYFTAACILSGQFGIAPEADPILLKQLVESLQTINPVMGSPTLKPTLPARYRIPIFLRLRASLNSSEICALYPPPQKQTSIFYYSYYYSISYNLLF